MPKPASSMIDQGGGSDMIRPPRRRGKSKQVSPQEEQAATKKPRKDKEQNAKGCSPVCQHNHAVYNQQQVLSGGNIDDHMAFRNDHDHDDGNVQDEDESVCAYAEALLDRNEVVQLSLRHDDGRAVFIVADFDPSTTGSYSQQKGSKVRCLQSITCSA